MTCQSEIVLLNVVDCFERNPEGTERYFFCVRIPFNVLRSDVSRMRERGDA